MNIVNSSENSSPRLIYDLSYLQDDEALKDSALIVFNSQRENHNDFLKNNFHEDKNALDKVSEESLHSALNETTKVSDIVQDRKLSNCIAYNFDNVKDAIISEKLKYLREKVDEIAKLRIQEFFKLEGHFDFENTGHFWYPPNGYMGWHTNNRNPGWRFYISYVDKPGKSFFRYRDPISKEIITSYDKQWNFRLFKVSLDKSLWHAVYSDTHRFSIGYTIKFDE
ncbi:MAG: hypothetical protein E4H07_04860 [Nitrosomonadales bacterium]|jgi:hypothetical protein|nr:MAG: hypothetical protein E4H07_04860 [Nitrosomonadales bacterium]